jgi:hypothetical protein
MTRDEQIQAVLDRQAILQVVQGWPFWRDNGRWEELRNAYTADGLMTTTWTVSTADDFVNRAKAAFQAPKYLSQHVVGVSTIELNGDRAIGETRMIVMVRGPYMGVEVDVVSWGRTHDRFVREPDQWRIKQRTPIYDRDRLDPVDPNQKVTMDPAELEKYPQGYRRLAVFQASTGLKITPDLPTPGSASIAKLFADGKAWLAGK